MGRILRDAIISLGFMMIFLEASSLFAGKSGKSTKRSAMVQEVSEKEKEIQGKRDKFLQKLAIAIQEKNIDKINRMLKLLAYPPATCKAIKKAMLRNSMTRYLAVRMILDNNDDLKAMELPFLAELLTAIIGTLHINEYSKIHEDYHHIFVREA